MKNKKMSRLFSIILCLGVVASLLPSGNALAAGDESVVFNFGYNQNNAAGDTDISEKKTVTDIADYGDKGARKWKYRDSKNLRSNEPPYYYGNYTQIRTNSGGWIAFELTGLASAEYKMTVNHTAYSAAPIAHAYLYIFPVEELGAGTVEDYLASGRAVKAGSLDGSKDEKRTFEGVQLAPSASNTYVLVASTSVKAGTFKLTDITFTPTGEYKETGAASQSPFGELAAYIEKKNDASYTINVLSAIKSLDYKKIGFKIMLDGEAENSPAAFVEINTLYNQVNAPDFGGEPLTAAWFFEGGSQDGYVFIGERELASADAEGKKLIFCPYALKNDDTAVWGNEFTVTVGGGN